MYNVMHLPGVIEIGVTGENQFRRLEFDMRPWLEVLPGGVGSIVHIRPGETGDDAYVAATTMEDGILTWELTAGDVGEVEGYGQMEVWLEDPNTARGKSARCQTYVRSSLALTHEIPEAQEAWLEQMTGLKTETVIAAQSAEDAKEAAESAQAAAEAARDAAQAAAGDFQGLSATASGLAAGTSPTVNVTHDEGGLFNLAFGIPKGDKGDQGDPPTDSQVQTAANNYLSQVITNPDSPPLDRALSSNAAAAPADMVGDLKSAFDSVTGYGNNLIIASDITDNARLTGVGGVQTQEGYYATGFIAVEEGLTYVKNSPTLDAYHRFCMYANNNVNTFIDEESESNEITIQSGCKYIRICGLMTEKTSAYVVLKTANDNVARANVNALADDEEELAEGTAVKAYGEPDEHTPELSSGYVSNISGSVFPDDEYQHTEKISVEPGDKITCGDYKMRFIAAYTGNSLRGGKGSGNEVAEFIVPETIDGIIISVKTTASFKVYISKKVYQNNLLERVISLENEVEELADASQNGFETIKSASLNSNSIELSKSELKKNYLMSFFCKIGTLGEINVGIKDGSYKNFIKITSTNLDVNANGHIATNQHGLTLSNDIQVHAIVNDIGKIKVSLFSDGEMYETNEIDWVGTINWNGNYTGIPYVEAVSGSYTDCCFTYGSKDFQKELWAFGDSYFSFTTNERWTYYLIGDGYMNNLLLSGWPGENSAYSLTALNNYLNQYKEKPKKIIWALGMNDGTDGSVVNSTWLSGIESFLSICEANGIEPILCTIPSALVTASSALINNEKKNEWIRSHDYRYIDFAEAVGSQSDGSWTEGYKSSDGVRPSAKGAKALYFRAITDCPEITYHNN